MTTKASIGQRGIGERVSRSVDEAIVDITRRAEPRCLTFAAAHDKVGREVASVVVIREGSEAMATVLRERAAAVHADFIVPQ